MRWPSTTGKLQRPAEDINRSPGAHREQPPQSKAPRLDIFPIFNCVRWGELACSSRMRHNLTSRALNFRGRFSSPPGPSSLLRSCQGLGQAPPACRGAVRVRTVITGKIKGQSRRFGIRRLSIPSRQGIETLQWGRGRGSDQTYGNRQKSAESLRGVPRAICAGAQQQRIVVHENRRQLRLQHEYFRQRLTSTICAMAGRMLEL